MRDFEGHQPAGSDPVDEMIERTRALAALGRHEDALRLGRQALASRPDDAEVVILVARLLVESGQGSEALALSERAVALAPDNVLTHFVRGWALSTQERTYDAVAAFRHAVTLSPTTALVRCSLVDTLVVLAGGDRARPGESGDGDLLAEARAHADEALRLAPTDPEPHVAQATVALAANDLPAARHWAEEALARDPNHAPAHRMLGVVAQRQDRPGAAGDHYLAAAKVDPTSEMGLRHLRRAHRQIVFAGISAVVLVVWPLGLLAFYATRSEGIETSTLVAGLVLGLVMIPFLFVRLLGGVPRGRADFRAKLAALRSGVQERAKDKELSPEAREVLRRDRGMRRR